MSQTTIARPFPKGALIGAAGLIALALASATVARLTGIGRTTMPETAVVESRDLRFADRQDGGIDVFEEQAGATAAAERHVYEVPPGTNGFVRGVLRGLARERKLEELGHQSPFRMTRWADGRLSIEDPSTGRWIDLGAFGPTNAEAFARIFTAHGDPVVAGGPVGSGS